MPKTKAKVCYSRKKYIYRLFAKNEEMHRYVYKLSPPNHDSKLRTAS